MSEACSIHSDLTTWPLMSMPRMFAGVRAALVGVVGQLDAAGLAPPADVHLGLDHDRIADASAAATASSTVVTARPRDTGMP